MPRHEHSRGGQPESNRQHAEPAGQSRPSGLSAEPGQLAPESAAVDAEALPNAAPRLDDGRLPASLRQSLAIRLGRVQGNRHLQRALSGLHSSGPAEVQRQADEFHPRIFGVVFPGGPVKLGDEHSETYEVYNIAEAPAGTLLTWVSTYGEILDPAGPVQQPRRGTYELRLRAMAPGTTTVGVSFGYTLPSGESESVDLPEETVTVPRPEVEFATITREDAGGQVLPNAERMRVGERLRVTLYLANVSDTRSDYGVRAQITGAGVLAIEQARVVGPGQCELLFRATRLGTSRLQVRVLPGRTPPESAPPTELETHVEMSKDEFLSLTNQVNTIIDLADRSARAYLASLSLAYGKAYKTHTGLLKDQAESEKLASDLILGAALAFVPGGIGGIIGSSMKAAGSGDFIIDGIKDLAKWGMRTGAGLAAQSGLGSSGLNAFPTDPLAWKGQEELRISSELAEATRMLLQWQDKANRNDPDFFLDFNPVEAMAQSLTVAGRRAAELAPVDQEETANAFEKGMWAKWLELYGYRLATQTRGGMAPVVRYYAKSNVGKNIKRRCEALGLNVEQYARVAAERVGAEAERYNRISW